MNQTITPTKCQIADWGLPPLVISWFKKKGINSLFKWQAECLCKDNVLSGDNLVYSAPTSAGKTLVADFLLIKRVLEHGKKALVIEPFVALTREKAAELKSMLYTTNARVGAFGGSYYTPGGMASVKVAVCTIEKANNFVNKLINENKLSDIGIIVVDEIHYLGDERRGHQLELLLTKVLYFNSQQDKSRRIQIVGLSATIPNLKSIATWLKASLYVTDFRPVPLVEKIKISNKIYEVTSYLQDPSCDPIETIAPERILIDKDFDDLCYLCIDSIVNGHSVLVFCESKRECELMARNLADQIKISGNRIDSEISAYADVARKLRDRLSRVKIMDVLGKLKKCPAGPDRELVGSMGFAVAFHHAGLTSEEREIIEDGFKSGAIKALMATSTLSSGVNLPARRVVIKSPTMVGFSSSGYQKEMLNPTTYRQMIGRAGRKNIDTCGESILICRPENQATAIKLIKASLGEISSSLALRMMADGEPSGLKKAILEAIANKTASSRDNLIQYLKSTFWLSSSSEQATNEFMKAVNDTFRYLVTKKFIEELKPGVYRSTRLGNAVLASGLHPDESLELVQDLIRARQGFILLNDLHIIYQVTPNDIARTVEFKDWQHYSKVWNDLDEICQGVGERVGIDEITIARRCQGFMGTLCEEKERIYKRFWVALIINDLINEMPLPKICQKYNMSKAMVQQSQRAVAQFAGVISIFCQELGYDNIAALVNPLESRINFSCQRDLLDLIRLNITRPIARVLFNAGYKNTIAVAKADKLDIEFVIRQLKPFKKDVSFTEDSKNPPSLWVPELAMNMTYLDYASHIVDEARSHVEIEYDIDLTPQPSKRSSEEVVGSSANTSLSTDSGHPSDTNTRSVDKDTSVESRGSKRGRIDDGLTREQSFTGLPEPLTKDLEPTHSSRVETTAQTSNQDQPKFSLEYLAEDSVTLNNFLEQWTRSSGLSINFKLTKRLNEPIGAKIKRQICGSGNSQGSDEGIGLRLDIESQKYILTRLYVCFDDQQTVYVANNSITLSYIRDNLAKVLASTKSSPPVKLFTQNIVPAYKVLHAALNLDPVALNCRFEWHSFDVVWWMINNCPTRGLNNHNSSLSLVAKTPWARDYHHFLHPDAHRKKLSFRGSQLNYLRLKDIVKAGKTAILKPLISELLASIEAKHQLRSYIEAEIPSRVAMSQMIVHGIGLNIKHMRDELNLYEDLMERISEIAQKYYAKSSISLRSISHVARVLYEDLDLKKYLLEHSTISDITKDPTNSEILNILGQYHPFPKLVQGYRKIGKALEALQSVNTHARFNSDLNMVRVFGHCDFWQLTGRVSMYDPDLFLINRNFSIEIPAHGNRQIEVIDCAPRRCFVPFDGWILLAADYSQLELRLLAHFSGDTNLLEILNQDLDSSDNFDVFKTIASKIHHKPTNEISGEQRQQAKQICYGMIYGMGNTTLSNRLNVDQQRADNFRQDFYAAFPKILTYIEELIAECRQTGYVESLLKRRRPLDGINAENNSSLRAKAERVAINTRIQSSASDIIKLAIRSVNQRIIGKYSSNVRMVLEMHDELIYEVNPFILNEFARELKFDMERITSTEALKVKLLVNLKKGTDWSNLEDFKL